jgi:hypothetical protein
MLGHGDPYGYPGGHQLPPGHPYALRPPVRKTAPFYLFVSTF